MTYYDWSIIDSLNLNISCIAWSNSDLTEKFVCAWNQLWCVCWQNKVCLAFWLSSVSKKIDLEEPIRLPSPHRINVSVSACVRYGYVRVLILWFMQQFHNAKVMSHQSQYDFCVTCENSDIDRNSCMSTGKKVPPAHVQQVFIGSYT